MNYLVSQITFVCIYALMALSFNITTGYTGLLNLGHIGLVGVGGYASAIFALRLGLPVSLSIALAGVIAMLVAFVLALPTKRIKGDYFALVTLGFVFVVQAVFMNWDGLTRGTLGFPGIPRPEGADGLYAFSFFVFVITVALFLFLHRMGKSPFGRALEAVRDDEEVASTLGKPVWKLKIIAMMVSGFVAGVSGALLAHHVQFISPQTFWLPLVITVLAILILGGLASLPGSLLGTLAVFLIVEPLRFVDSTSSHIGAYRLIIFSALVVLAVLFRPKGIMGRAQLEE